jgi:signal transduction histidine kinase
MRPSDSLRRRIVVAYLLFAIAASLLFAIIAAVAVEGIETHLVDNRLEEIAAWASPRYAGKLPVDMPAGLTFHHGDAIPLSLRGLPPGAREVHVDGIGLHVLAGHDTLGPYVVVDHESDYEKVELVVYSLFLAGFLGFLLMSLMLGGFVARRFVTPIAHLAQAVEAGGTALPLLGEKNELGVLARAFDAHTMVLREYLDRERYFTGDVSHELRSPLTVIMGAAEILLARAEVDPAIRAPAERIYRAAREASECVNVLLLLARAPALAEQPLVNAGAVVRDELLRHVPLAEGKQLRLKFDGGADFEMRAPRDLLAAAVGNLIRNACQHTAAGDVLVRLGPGSVIVEDCGPGLPAAVRATISDQQAVVPSTGSAGTGLGLSLVKRICAYLGGRLEFADRPGGGSVFKIVFTAPSQKSHAPLTGT